MVAVRNLFCIIVLCVGILILIYFIDVQYSNLKYSTKFHSKILSKQKILETTTIQVIAQKSRFIRNNSSNEVVIALVLCGERLQEAFVVIKSAIVFHINIPLRFIILAEENLRQNIDEKLESWQLLKNNSFQYEIYPIQYPPSKGFSWKGIFKKCATQRLFLPDVLSHIDSVLYVDLDTIILSPLYDTWKHLSLMNSTQMMAISLEAEEPNTSWYYRFARHPFYSKTGVNSGVMLMNLTRMRNVGWTKYMEPLYKEYKNKLTWGDQDIINSYFHFHPETVYVLSCRYNFRSDHCMYMMNCDSAMKEGVAILHGSRSIFHSGKEIAFKVIYQAFEEYQPNQDPYENLLAPLELYLRDTRLSKCGTNYTIYLKYLREVIRLPVI